MTPPAMAGWNLTLRFGLEVAALISLGAAARILTSGPLRWVAVVAVSVVAATAWGMFNVLNDPSRSGAAPIEVRGWTRLVLELLILGGGAAALVLAGRPGLGMTFAVLIAIQYATSWSRVGWLLQT